MSNHTLLIADGNVTLESKLTTNTIETATLADASEKEQLYFWTFGVFLVMLSSVGIVTNFLNMYALGRTVRSHAKPMYHYLIAMAVVDFMVMTLLFVRAIRFYLSFPMLISKADFIVGDEILVDNPTYVFYNIWFLISDTCMTISNWCTVAMGAFRIIAVFWPFKSATFCTVGRARVVIVAICVASILVNLPLILQVLLGYDGRVFKLDSNYDKYNIISLIMTVPLPILSCILINSALITRIKLNRIKISKMFANVKSQDDALQKQASVTNHAERTLIGVSLFYVIMSIPNVSYYIASYAGWLRNMEHMHITYFYIVGNLFVYMNHACNFFFYVLLNKPFRKLIWSKVRGSHRSPSTQITRSSIMRSRESIALRRISNVALNGHCKDPLMANGRKNGCSKPSPQHSPSLGQVDE